MLDYFKMTRIEDRKNNIQWEVLNLGCEYKNLNVV